MQLPTLPLRITLVQIKHVNVYVDCSNMTFFMTFTKC